MKLYGPILPKELFFSSVPTMSPEVLPRGPVRSAIDSYTKAFNAVGVQPDAGSNQAWDTSFIIVNAFRKLGTDATPAQLRNYLDHLTGFTGADGVYNFQAFPKHGVGSNWTVVQRWDPVKQTFVGASKPGGAPI